MRTMEPVGYRAEDYELEDENQPAAFRVGPRVVLLAALAAVSVFDPTRATLFGPFLAVLIYITGRPLRLRVDVPNLTALALAVWALLSFTWSTSPDLSLRVGLNYAAMVVVFIVARDAIRTVAQLRTVVIGYILGCFALAWRVIAEARTGTALPGGRLSIDGLNINYAGYAFAVGFAMILLLWVTKPLTLRRRVGLLLTTAALVLGVQLSDTRGAFVGLGLLAAWLLLCAIFKHPPFKMLIVLVVVAAAAIATGAVDRASLALESMLGRATGDWSGRLVIWPMARDVWSNDFWVGAGASTFQNVMGVGAHNLILEVGTGLGVVGVFLYAVVLWSSLGKRTEIPGTRLRPILIGSFIAVSMFSYLTGHWELAPAAWIALAVFSRIGLLGKDPAMQWRTAESTSATPESPSKLHR